MAWLRMRPASFSDLAMVDSRGRWVAESDESSDDQDDSAHRGTRERFDDVSFADLCDEWELMRSLFLNRAIMTKRISRKTKRRKRMTSPRLHHPRHSYREDDR